MFHLLDTCGYSNNYYYSLMTQSLSRFLASSTPSSESHLVRPEGKLQEPPEPPVSHTCPVLCKTSPQTHSCSAWTQGSFSLPRPSQHCCCHAARAPGLSPLRPPKADLHPPGPLKNQTGERLQTILRPLNSRGSSARSPGHLPFRPSRPPQHP